jgi:Conserved hypothetical protein 2217 (DUF2460)
MTSFHEVRFPDNIAYGATGGPEFATTVVATGSGHEKRNVNWSEARGRWDVASGLKKQAQIDELIAFFRARRGKAYGLRFKDWADYKATGQLLPRRHHSRSHRAPRPAHRAQGRAPRRQRAEGRAPARAAPSMDYGDELQPA